MAKHRAERFSGELQRELGAIISREVKDPRLEFVSVVAVDAAPDLTSARVHLSALNNKYSADEIKAALNSCSGFIRRELGKRLKARVTPELFFQLDDSIAYAIDMMRRIDAVVAADETAAAGRAPEDEGKYIDSDN